MSKKKEKYSVPVKRSDKDLIAWRKDSFGKMRKMYREHTVFIWIIILLIVAIFVIAVSGLSRMQTTLDGIADSMKVLLSDEQAEKKNLKAWYRQPFTLGSFDFVVGIELDRSETRRRI